MIPKQKLIGFEKQNGYISRARENGRLAHAYALIGPENIGKTAFALNIARTLVSDPILDIALYDTQSGLTVDQSRELRSRLSLMATGYKVAIVTYAERMNQGAANALLKVLEEAPGKSVIFIVTSNAHALLPTISSRVQKIYFDKFSPEQILEVLAELSEDREKIEEIAQYCDGRPGLAIRFFEDGDLFSFYKECHRLFDLMKSDLPQDMQEAALAISSMEREKAEIFVKLAMSRWGADPNNAYLAKKLMRSWRELEQNVNIKLLADNLVFV